MVGRIRFYVSNFYCTPDILQIYNKEKKKKKISHFKMPTLKSDVTVNSYNNIYENFAILSKNIHYYFDNKNFIGKIGQKY
jgi:hypothetical protein